MNKKLHHLTMRVSEPWLEALRKTCQRKARTVTAHIERCIEVSRVVDECCSGNDDPDFLRRLLARVSGSRPRAKTPRRPSIQAKTARRR